VTKKSQSGWYNITKHVHFPTITLVPIHLARNEWETIETISEKGTCFVIVQGNSIELNVDYRV
jgi:hypothetical protein